MDSKVYSVNRTTKTPEINGDLENGELKITGVSIPEDAKDFYFPLRTWMLDFIQCPKDSLRFTVEMDYFNTSTSSILLNLFQLFQRAGEKKNVEILWIYEEDDLDMKEVGEDYKLMVGDILRLEMRPL